MRWLVPFLALLAGPAAAAEVDPLAGVRLGFVWTIPFVGLLLSIAVLPMVAPGFWHRRYPVVAAAWAMGFFVPLVAMHGMAVASEAVAHMMLLDYLPFIVLLLALYTVTGGIAVTGTLRGTPAVNTALLAVGTSIASVAGTTGAAMLLIHPVLRANRERRHRTHIFVFFIILVANVGGALTPLGDPPLFLGFMEGVPFFWPTRHLFLPTLLIAALLLAAFWLLDTALHRREQPGAAEIGQEFEKLHVRGRRNIALLAAVLGAVLLSGVWDPGVVVPIPGAPVPLEKLVATALLVVITIISLRRTSRRWRVANEFSWGAMREVAILFAAIFVTIVPALHLLREGPSGPAALVFALLQSEAAYFWATGVFSAYLDNAPTYLVFFTIAGGDAARLVAEGAGTLTAISMGAVYFGALTYIGNAPNLMVRAVVEGHGARMPNFFAYTLWAALLLFPVFGLVTILFL